MKEKKPYVKATSDIYGGERRQEKGDRKVGQKVCKFEDLEVWKEGLRLATNIYRVLRTCGDYGLRDQMQRGQLYPYHLI